MPLNVSPRGFKREPLQLCTDTLSEKLRLIAIP